MSTTLQVILREHSIPFAEHGEHTHTTDGWINLNCCWCSRNYDFYLGIHATTGAVNCWACGKHSLVATLVQLLGNSYADARELAQDLHLRSGRRQLSTDRHSVQTVIPGGVGPMLPQHKAYLLGRGANPALLARRYGVQGIGQAFKLAWRLFIPIVVAGEVVSWTTRSILPDAKQRYHSAKPTEEKQHHKHVLYGEDQVKDTIIVCEGPTSVWRIGPGAVATFGTGFTNAQALRIASYPVRVVLFDNEPFAQKKARELCGILRVFEGRTYNVQLETGNDPGEATDKEIQELRERFL